MKMAPSVYIESNCRLTTEKKQSRNKKVVMTENGTELTARTKNKGSILTLNCYNSYTFGVQTCTITERGANLNPEYSSLHPQKHIRGAKIIGAVCTHAEGYTEL